MPEKEMSQSLQAEKPSQEPKAPGRMRRWARRLLLTGLSVGLLVLGLLAGVFARPWILIFPGNYLLAAQPIRVTMDDGYLVMPQGWRHPGKWHWRFENIALISHKKGTPTLMADLLLVRLPDLRKSWQMQSIVIPKAGARGFTVFIPQASPPPPFEEKDAWPVHGLCIDQAILLDFKLVLRDQNGMVIAMDDVDGQVLDFQYDFGRRLMFGHGDSAGGSLAVGPLEARNLRALPIDFTGKTMVVRGFGNVRHQRAHVVLAIDGLFRAGAAIHAEFTVENADVRSLLKEALGDDAPDMDGRLWAQAVIDSKPKDLHVDAQFRLENTEILLPEDTKKLILAAIKIAPFVELKDHLVRLGPLSGHVAVGDQEIRLVDGLYKADKSMGRVDGRLARNFLRARVQFVPEPGSGSLPWGLLLSGSLKHPKIQLADQKVLEAWNIDGTEDAEAIREDVKAAKQDRREMKREARRAGHGKDDEREAEEAPEGSGPPLEGPVEVLPL